MKMKKMQNAVQTKPRVSMQRRPISGFRYVLSLEHTKFLFFLDINALEWNGMEWHEEEEEKEEGEVRFLT